MTDDYYDGINDATAGRPYNVDAPGIHHASYGTGYDEGCFMRREREEAAESPVLPETMDDRIRGLRKGRRLSLDKLAKAAGCSKSYLWGLETEASLRPLAEKLARIASALGIRSTIWSTATTAYLPWSGCAPRAWRRCGKKPTIGNRHPAPPNSWRPALGRRSGASTHGRSRADGGRKGGVHDDGI